MYGTLLLMVAMLASRVALSCEPINRSTLSSSISRTADFAVSAGGPPASVNSSLTCRPRMPPALLIFSAARSAQARCVGPNSAAGPLSAMKKPILNSLACANDGKPTPSTAVPAAADRTRRRDGMNAGVMASRSFVVIGGAASARRRGGLRQHGFDRTSDRQQPRVGALRRVEFQPQRQAGARHRRRQ